MTKSLYQRTGPYPMKAETSWLVIKLPSGRQGLISYEATTEVLLFTRYLETGTKLNTDYEFVSVIDLAIDLHKKGM